jgi:hypothetical protein
MPPIRADPRPVLLIGGEAQKVNEEGTDVGALAGLCLHYAAALDLTDYKAMEVLRDWKW